MVQRIAHAHSTEGDICYRSVYDVAPLKMHLKLFRFVIGIAWCTVWFVVDMSYRWTTSARDGRHALSIGPPCQRVGILQGQE